jgi:hypothetical protein
MICILILWSFAYVFLTHYERPALISGSGLTSVVCIYVCICVLLCMHLSDIFIDFFFVCLAIYIYTIGMV